MANWPSDVVMVEGRLCMHLMELGIGDGCPPTYELEGPVPIGTADVLGGPPNIGIHI